jgi:hypothetical protein
MAFVVVCLLPAVGLLARRPRGNGHGGRSVLPASRTRVSVVGPERATLRRGRSIQDYPPLFPSPVGTIVEDKDVEEALSVKDFDVALHAGFEDKAAKAKYLSNERHQQYGDEDRDLFAGVRVFDSFRRPSAEFGG